VLIVVTWLSTVYVLWISCIVSFDSPSEMGTSFITVWFHCNLIVKLIRGMESGTILKELVSVFDLRK
jgi:hypothetical protein